MEKSEAAAERLNVVVREVSVRPARADERRRWDGLMAEHHYLGFKQFAGRGLRHVAEWRGHWVALVGWQSGAFKCGPRDRWLGWHRSVRFRRLHLIGNNTRFLVLPEAWGVPGLASRHNGRYTDAQGSRKEMYVRPLRRKARERLADAVDRVEWGSPKEWSAPWRADELRSLRDLFAELPDCRRDQGKKHRLATVLSLVALARLSGRSGPAAAERYAKALSQEELAAVGAWRNPRAGTREAPSDSTFRRVMADTDPDALRQVLSRWSAPRAEADAAREETAAREREAAATAALLEDVDVRGRMVTLDALHSSYDTERRLIEMHGADYLFAVKANCTETFEALAALDWDAPGVRRHEAPPEKARGRIERRAVAALDLPKGMLNFRHARQAFRVRRQRAVVKTGRMAEETAYGICSVAAERAGPERLPAWNRGHWMVENGNHHPRDASLGEDACRVRARHAPANNATMNNIALAVVRHRGFRFVPEAIDHFPMRRVDAFDAVLSPD